MGDIFEFLANAHVGIAAKLDIRAAAGHVGGNGDRAGHSGLADDIRLLFVVARVEDGEYLGFGRADHRRNRARAKAFGSEKSCCSQPRGRSISASCSDFSIEVVPTSTGCPRALQSSINVRMERYFSAAVR